MRGRPGSGIGELAVMPNKADKGRIGAAIAVLSVVAMVALTVIPRSGHPAWAIFGVIVAAFGLCIGGTVMNRARGAGLQGPRGRRR